MFYKVDTTEVPIKVDLIVTKIESGEVKKLLCIANFISNNEMEFAFGFDDSRPVHFNDKNTVLLKRKIE